MDILNKYIDIESATFRPVIPNDQALIYTG